MPSPLAYHITFGTYGTRLHGGPRATVLRTENQPGDSVFGPHPEWELRERRRMPFPPVVFTWTERCFIEDTLPRVCRRGEWLYLASAAAPDHVHVLLSSGTPGASIRTWLKRWLTEELRARRPLPEGATYWAKGGSVKHINDSSYLASARLHVERQRTLRT